MATPEAICRRRAFFAWSDRLDYLVLRPLSHISMSWELTWDHAAQQYVPEKGSFAKLMNGLIDDLAAAEPPGRYHDNEDRLAEYVVEHLKWPIRKQGGRWVGADYVSILEQGAYRDLDHLNLILAAAGRMQAALDRGQDHFDQMEEGHQRMLAGVLTVILYHREIYDPIEEPDDDDDDDDDEIA